jgi:putative ABC transport system permease protein
MPRIPGLRRAFRLVVRGPTVAEDVEDELQFHIDMRTRELIETGMSPDAARAEALRCFGDLRRVRDRCESILEQREGELRRSELLRNIFEDLSYGARTLARNRGFAVAALVTLALGIGATTAIFSVVDGVLLRPLPYREPNRLVRIWSASTKRSLSEAGVSVPDLEDWRRESRTLESIAGWSATGAGLTLLGGDEPARLRTAYVTEDFFRVLSVPALVGRMILPDEHRAGANRVVVLSRGLWERRFGGDPTVVGRTVTLDGEPFTVVGIADARFRFPRSDIEVWTPLSTIGEDRIPRARYVRFMNVIGRIAPGRTLAEARAELGAIAARLEAQYPESNTAWGEARLELVRNEIVGGVRVPLLILLGTVGCVLLIACVNVANLLLARTTARRREMAVRSALGAARARLIRQLLTESILLAVLGGALGIVVATWGVKALTALSADFLPRVEDIRTDWRLIVFSFALSISTGLLFGLVPALRIARSDLGDFLNEGGRGSSAAVAAQRLNGALVVGELALALMLVTGAGLMIRSLTRLLRVDPGFDPTHVIAVTVSIDQSTYPGRPEFVAAYDRFLESVRMVPGVRSAAAVTTLPLRGNGEVWPFTIAGRAEPKSGEEPQASVFRISDAYLETMRVPLLAGRTVQATDDEGSPPVAVINEVAARRFWPAGSPVGETIQLGGRAVRIIGVAGAVYQTSLDSAPAPAMYVPMEQDPRRGVSLVVRTDADPRQIAPMLRRAIWSVDGGQPISEIIAMRELVAGAAARPRLVTVLLALFGAIALMLAAVGLYGVVSYTVSQRAREFGVRVALGARQRDIVASTLRRVLPALALGVALGLAGALALTRVFGWMLYGVSASDPATFAAVTALLAAVAFCAAYVPARRAARVDPLVALRAEQ